MTTTYKTAADSAATIRAALKQKGWTTRDVSVRAKNFAGGSSVHIQVKNPDVPLKAVEAIAKGEEHVRRCEYSGEILSGGNRYVSVDYSYEAQQALVARRLADVEAALAKVDGNVLIPVGDSGYLVGKQGWEVTLWHRDQAHIVCAGDARWAAFTIASREVES